MKDFDQGMVDISEFDDPRMYPPRPQKWEPPIGCRMRCVFLPPEEEDMERAKI